MPVMTTRVDCPSAEVLLRFHRRKLSSRTQRKVRDHIAACLDCGRKSKFVLDVLKEEDGLIQNLEAILPEHKRRARRRGRDVLHPFGYWMIRAVPAAVLALFLIVLLNPRRDPPADRTDRAPLSWGERPPSALNPVRGLFAGRFAVEPRYDQIEDAGLLSGRPRIDEIADSFRLLHPAGLSSSGTGGRGYYGWSLAISATASSLELVRLERRIRPMSRR
jgi:hypothetical protein